MATKHLKFLRSQLAKAEKKGDGLAQCQLLSQMGTEHSSKGHYAESAQCHIEQLALCKPFSLPPIEEALSHRQLGECLVMLGNFKDAHRHHTSYLRLSREYCSKKDILEALTTVGRTAFLWANALFEDNEQTAATDWLLFAQQKFLDSLDLCDQLHDEISEHDLLDMRSRLYLNLANVFSQQNQRQKEVKAHLMKALNLAKCLVSREIELMVWINLADCYDKSYDFKEALAASEKAAGLAEKLDDKLSLTSALETAAQALICAGDFVNGKKYLKKAYQSYQGNDEEKTILWKKLSQVVRICHLCTELSRLEKRRSQSERAHQCGLLEQLGDRCCRLKAYHIGIEYYSKQLRMCKSLGTSRQKVMSVLVSLATTHADVQEHADAVHYYQEEIALRQPNEHKEISQTYSLVATEQLAGEFPEEEVLKSYSTAIEHAEFAGNMKLKASTLQAQAEALDKFNRADEAADARHHGLEISVDLPTSSSGSSGGASDEESSEVCVTDDSESEEEAGQVLPKRQQQLQLAKLDKKNHRGETKLHEATISGKIKVVKSYIQQGANVNTRDFCGWTPLHEACNWGHTAVAELLLENKANVNDVANAKEVTTPLHDALRNEHQEIALLLLKFNADVSIPNSKGQTPLDIFVDVTSTEEGSDRTHWPGECQQVYRALLKAGAQHRKGFSVQESLPRHAAHPNRSPVATEKGDQGKENDFPGPLTASTATGGVLNGRRLVNERLSTLVKERSARSKRAPAVISPAPLRSSGSTSSLSDADVCSFAPSLARRNGDGGAVKPVPQPVPVLSSDTEAMSSDNGLDVSSPATSQALAESDWPLPTPVHVVVDSRATAEVGRAHCQARRHSQPCRQQRLRGVDMSSESDDDDDRHHHDGDLAQPSRHHARKRKRMLRVSPPARTTPLQAATVPAATPAGNVAALVDEHEIVNVPGEDDWLIDDLPRLHAVTKTRTRTPRAKAQHSALSRCSSSNMSTKTLSSRDCDRPLATSQPAAVISSDDDMLDDFDDRFFPTDCDSSVTGEVVDTEVTRPSLRHTEKSLRHTEKGPLRLKVKVDQFVYLISCPHHVGYAEEEATIAWLAEQAAVRYMTSTGLKGTIELCTVDGALLDPKDCIAHILSDNEMVHSKISAISVDPVDQRYADACSTTHTDSHREIAGVLKSSGGYPTKLSFANCAIPMAHVKLLMQSLRGTDSLAHLDLSGSGLCDAGVFVLCQHLSSLPGLLHLDLSVNALGVESLAEMAKCVAKCSNAPTSVAHHPVPSTQHQGLKYLHLGFNVFCTSASRVLCPLLSKLSLHTLSLPGSFVCPIVQPSLFDWFGCRHALVKLDLSYNCISLPDLECLVCSIAHDALEEINLTASIVPSVPGCVGRLFACYLAKPGCALRSLFLSSCSLSNDDVQLMAQLGNQLREIDLSSNLISWQAKDSLERCVQSPLLRKFSLAGNNMLGTSTCAALIMLALQRLPGSASPLHLDLSACGVTSPLPPALLALPDGETYCNPVAQSRLPRLSSLAGRIGQLRLCHNAISTGDKAALAASWMRMKQLHAMCSVAGELCCLATIAD